MCSSKIKEKWRIPEGKSPVCRVVWSRTRHFVICWWVCFGFLLCFLRTTVRSAMLWCVVIMKMEEYINTDVWERKMFQGINKSRARKNREGVSFFLSFPHYCIINKKIAILLVSGRWHFILFYDLSFFTCACCCHWWCHHE